MRKIVALFLLPLIGLTRSHSQGLSSCIGPMHGPKGKLTSGMAGVTIRTSDNRWLHIESPTPILGFLLYGGITYTNIPDHAERSDICGETNKALSHTSAIPRQSLTVEYECDAGADSAILKGYIVFGVHEKHIAFDGRVRCPSADFLETSTTTDVFVSDRH